MFQINRGRLTTVLQKIPAACCYFGPGYIHSHMLVRGQACGLVQLLASLTGGRVKYVHGTFMTFASIHYILHSLPQESSCGAYYSSKLVLLAAFAMHAIHRWTLIPAPIVIAQ